MGEADSTAARRWPRVLAAGALLLLVMALTGVSLSLMRADAARIAARERQIHTLGVIVAAERTQADLFDAQRSVRGYLLVRDPSFLTPYQYAAARLPLGVGELRMATRDNPRQQARLARLDEVVRQQLAIMAGTVRVAGTGRSTADMLALQRFEGERLTSSARLLLQEIVIEEQRLLDDHNRAVDATVRKARRVQFALAGLAALLLVIAIAAAALSYRGFTAAQRASFRAAVASRARRELEGEVAERTAALTQANAELIAGIARAEAAEGQVRQMQKLQAIGQLTGGIAHDFNNMLAIVIGSLDLARRRVGEDAKLRQLLDNADAGAQRAAALTKRLLAFARQQPLTPEALDANRLVTHVSELLRRTLGERIQIETVLAGGLWLALIDANELENAVVNLAINARDAMGESGKLTIETACAHLDDAYAAAHPEVTPGQYVALCVSDTGSGMSADVIARAFDPFFTTKDVGKGTGLGLSQVFGFVKQSNGHVKIYSEEGQGTTVKLYLPRWHGPTAATSPEARPPEPGEPSRARDGEAVLVVEDEARVRATTAAMLRELGYTVTEAADPADALRRIEAGTRIDLLFTDIVMPEMNGRQLAAAALERRPALKVLYTTGFTKNAVVHNGVLDADVAFLAKPFTAAQLAAKLRQVLGDA